jgi:invasion protein IalB
LLLGGLSKCRDDIDRGWVMKRLLVSVVLATAATAAAAQTPQRTTATYEDWTVRCEVNDNLKSCEMAQAMQIKGQAQPVTQIAIGRPAKSDPLKIVFQVPINVWLPGGLKLTADEKDPGIVGIYRRCLPGACIADADLKEDVVKKLRALTENGKLQFKDGGQQDIAIPVSFKGFGQAFDAMLKP